MKTCWLDYRVLLRAFFVLLLFTLAGPALAEDRPNVVLIFADDLGWQEPGFAGSDFCETPHLDELAGEGMVFGHAYAAAGNCAPSRACMLSGQYTPRHRVFAVGSTQRGAFNQMRLTPLENERSLPLAVTTLGEAMKDAGYATGMFGKCHLTNSPQGKSEQRGFDVVKVSQHSLNSDDPEDPKGIFSITAAACDFIEANQDRPFFAYIPHYAVHSRLQGKKETFAHFRDKTPGKKHDSAILAACLADFDTGVGMVLKKLADLNLEKKTLVLFTSDNGGVHVSQEPLRGKKGCYYEGGIRVPMIVRWPGVVEPGSRCDTPVINVDFYPTFLAAAGAKPPVSSPLDGASLLPLLEGQTELQRPGIFWHFPGYLDGPVPRGRDEQFRTRPVSVIRQGDWKLHLYHEEWALDGGRDKLATNRAVELYNIATDPGETKDVAASQTEKRDELLDTLLAWCERVPAPLATEPNPHYQSGKRKGAGSKPGKKQ
ncbi:sulfatase [Lignipirellula cremea]|uniref:Arylsulfatase n=1 Tax=Lignipirellula cremea TaxID=2528010 RepID=A0A518E2W0_9BACT|nr:sulfatase [Lignipirellula cremea]QDU98425.1 Arylsulfatase [Lignipirellula cremea]